MSNYVAKGFTPDQKKMAADVCRELGLTNLRIRYEPKQSPHEVGHFRFSQDRRTVSVPESLIKEGRWSDIRFLFRAILQSPASLENTGSPNEWGELGEPV